MKVLKKKLKKVHIAKKFFYTLTTILYLVSLIYFIYGILKLKGIETLIRSIIIGIFIVWFIVYALFGLITLISKKKKTFIFITIITLLLCPIFTISSYYINKVYNEISNINSDKLIYTTNLISLKETNFHSKLPIGMIASDNDIEGNILAKKLIEKESLENKIELYEDYHSMISDLYKGNIGGCFVSSNYSIVFEDETFEGVDESIDEKVKVLYEYSEERDNQDVITLTQSKDKKLTEPFTVLIMGVDSTLDGLKANQAFNGDTLIMVTFNPKTLSATMFSLPRDLYVPIACNHNRYAKINSSAAYGSSCVINTIQQLTDIDIDYYVKINFTGVVKLVDALGGVNINVETPDYWYDNQHKNQVCEQNSQRKIGNNLVCMNLGWQKLNGEQALAYARCRHLYAMSDIARNQHQQALIESLAYELRNINSVSKFENILSTVSSNIETNMTPEQIMSFYSVGKDMLINSSGNTLSINKTYLSYYNLSVYLPSSGLYTSALGYYPESLEAITDLMKVNLELKEAKQIKTFSISYNEEYTTPLVGKGLTGGETLQKVKSFIGYNENEAETWCQNNNINCIFETVTDANYNGMIINQSAHEGELLKSISKITFYVSNGLGYISNNNDSEEEKDEESNTNKNNKDEEKDETNSSSSTDDEKKETPSKDDDEEEEKKDEENSKEEPKKEIGIDSNIPGGPEE